MHRLGGIVSNWKNEWKKKGDAAKPLPMDEEVASKKKNRIFGVGSIETVPADSSSQPHRTPQDHTEKNARLRQQIEEHDRRYHNITDFFSIIAMESPNLARLMQSWGVQLTQPPVIPPNVAEAATHELRRDLGIDDFELCDPAL
ncbi:unnamed protein product [Cochlearia groenlandica]